jgi:hypothetical protein
LAIAGGLLLLVASLALLPQRPGQAHGPAIELYQIGTRLGSGRRASQWFCRFSFASDSARRPPPVLLEVTFRDTTARAVLGFGLRRR